MCTYFRAHDPISGKVQRGESSLDWGYRTVATPFSWALQDLAVDITAIRPRWKSLICGCEVPAPGFLPWPLADRTFLECEGLLLK